MRDKTRGITTIATICSVIAGVALLRSLPLSAQDKSGRPPKTSWGQPDLSGVWDFSTTTPLQRPPELKDKAELTDAEVADQLQRAVAARARQDSSKTRQGDTGTYNRFWTDEPRVNKQTSLIIDPKDGRVPPYTPAAQKWYADLATTRKGIEMDAPTPGGFIEDLGPRGLFVRCIVGFNAGPPINPSAYNQNVQIFQTRDQVALLHEMVHNVRVAWLDGRPHVSRRIAQYNGDSRGRWEGETLIVETTNFGKDVYDPAMAASGMRPNVNGTYRLIERFTRTTADTLVYEFTIDDPSWYTAPLTARIPMTKNPEPIYEFACHEANHSMRGILEGARLRETEGTKSSSK